jgi:hypothetical protein
MMKYQEMAEKNQKRGIEPYNYQPGKRRDSMTPRTKWTIAATLIILLYGFGVVWLWGSPARDIDPGIAKEYKSFRIQGH